MFTRVSVRVVECVGIGGGVGMAVITVANPGSGREAGGEAGGEVADNRAQERERAVVHHGFMVMVGVKVLQSRRTVAFVHSRTNTPLAVSLHSPSGSP